MYNIISNANIFSYGVKYRIGCPWCGFVNDYTDEDYWHGNITHNMGKMADEVPVAGTELTLYDLLWRPDEHGFSSAGDTGYRVDVLMGFLYLRDHREDLIQFNPENGWGNYDLLLSFTLDFLQHLIMAGDDYSIRASR